MNMQKNVLIPFALAFNTKRICVTNQQKVPDNLNLAASNLENVLPIEQQLDEAINTHNFVIAYGLGIALTTFPTISSPSSWWCG